ncbi:hypothetical protein G6F43_007220 [Rhizopus delemar]|nr:hypothetical protein G6F43_007220 [Rhizopus delemar]
MAPIPHGLPKSFQPGNQTKSSKEVNGILARALTTLAAQRKDWYPLCTYCEQLKSYYKRKTTTDAFGDAWQLKQEKEHATKQGHVNGVKLSTLGAIRFGKELDNLIKEADHGQQNQENISPTASLTTTLGSDHEPQHDDQAVGAECDGLISKFLTMEEADEVYINESSVGTKIKHKALKIFRRWKDGELVTDQQLHWMACGLPSIWDLASIKLAQEFLECSHKDLEHLTRPFITKYKCTQYQTPAIFDQTFDIVASIIDKENNTRKAIEYIQNVKTRCTETQKLLQVIIVIVNIIESNCFLLKPDNIDRVTEYDFITQVWAPLLKSLVDTHGILRMKIGELSPAHGAIARKRTYSKDCVGFKVDLRLLYDSRQNEHDLLAMEVAKDGSTSKLCADVCKLMREAKDNIDNTLQHILKNKVVSLPSSWYMQANGLDAHLGSIHLAKPGLYLALHQGKLYFPRTLSTLLDFKNNVILLASMIFDLERNASMIRKSIDLIDDHRETTLNNQVEHDQPMHANSQLYMMRPTFYNPPRSNATVAILPHHLFGSSNTHPLSSAPSSPHHHDHSEPDEFGWATLDDGRFYHTLTGIIAERHPFEES